MKNAKKTPTQRARRAEILREVVAAVPPSSSAMAASIFAQSLAAIDHEIRGLRDGTIKPPKRYDKVDRIAYLAKQASSFAAEERKAAALDRKAADGITKAIVIAWARKLEAAERAQLAREIEDLNHHRSSLG